MKLKIYIPVLLTAALSVLSGCYTIIEHPDVQAKDENGYTYNNKVYFYDDCASCHQDQEHQGQMTRSEHMAMFKAHGDTSYDSGYYDNGYSDNGYDNNYYSDQYYYPTQYYGDYGYYYNTPWWYTVTPPEGVTKTRSNNNDRQAIQYNGRSRNESGDRSTSGRDTHQTSDNPRLSSPTVSTSSSSSSGGSSASSGSNVQSNSSQNKSETRSSSDNSSNSRSSNEQPRSRNNDSNRSSNSGRR